MDSLIHTQLKAWRKSSLSGQIHLQPKRDPADASNAGTAEPLLAATEEELSAVSFLGLSHDVRNILGALSLYCDLLAEPNVLTPEYRHYAEELRLVANAGSGLLERLALLAKTHTLATPSASKIVAMDLPVMDLPVMDLRVATPEPPVPPLPDGVYPDAFQKGAIAESKRKGASILVLSDELQQSVKLLSALAGPSIKIKLACQSYSGPLLLSCEDLTRVLINLVKNASEAMPSGGLIRIAVAPVVEPETGVITSVLLTVEDDGPGIAIGDLDHLFESGFTTKRARMGKLSWLTPEPHGLGLAIVRGLLHAAGASIIATSPEGKGARFEMNLPVRTAPATTTIDADPVAYQKGTRVQCY